MATRSPSLNYDQHASDYARHRRVHSGVLQALLATGPGPESSVLDVGCGTGNYAAALIEGAGWRVSGVDPSAQMLERARDAAPWEALLQGSAERLPFADASFDLVMSTDVIHHVRDREAYFREAARVLRPGGQIVTVTDSHDDIRRRRPLSSHFPETVAIELDRYPPVAQLLAEMTAVRFRELHAAEVGHTYDLVDLQPYRDRAFSSLLLIGEEAFHAGIGRLEADRVRGPIPCLSLYTMIWGKVPLP